MTSNKRFEQWAESHDYDLKLNNLGDGGIYDNPDTANAFNGWQACEAQYKPYGLTRISTTTEVAKQLYIKDKS
jgi:hypothetical protein